MCYVWYAHCLCLLFVHSFVSVCMVVLFCYVRVDYRDDLMVSIYLSYRKYCSYTIRSLWSISICRPLRPQPALAIMMLSVWSFIQTLFLVLYCIVLYRISLHLYYDLQRTRLVLECESTRSIRMPVYVCIHCMVSSYICQRWLVLWYLRWESSRWSKYFYCTIWAAESNNFLIFL
jgi:hypothetical protein